MINHPNSDQKTPAPHFALSASTMQTYTRAFSAFEQWCVKYDKVALPASPDSIVTYLRRLSALGMRAATIRVAHAAIVDTHIRAGHPITQKHRRARAALADIVKAETRPQLPPTPLTAENLAAIRATACTPRKILGRSSREEWRLMARTRGLMDISIISVMRDGLLRRSEAAALRWGDLTTLPDGSGRISLTGAPTSQHVVFIGRAAVADLLTIRPDGAALHDGSRIFGLSPTHLGKRVRGAAIAAGLGDGYTSDSCRAGMAEDLNQAFPWRTPGHQERYHSSEAAGRGLVAQYYSLTRERVAIQR